MVVYNLSVWTALQLEMSAVVFLLLFFLSSGLAVLPKGWKACSKSSPDFSSCLAKEYEAAIKSLVDGDEELDVPSLDPLHVDKLEFFKGSGKVVVNMTLYNMSIHGFKDLTIHNFQTDWKTGKSQSHMPKLTILTSYNANGKIFILPFKGDGKCKFTFSDVDLESKFTFKRETIDGTEHLLYDEYILNAYPKKLHLHFENLYNGNKELEEITNQFLNENWKQIMEDFRAAATNPTSRVFATTANNILRKIPAHEIDVP